MKLLREIDPDGVKRRAAKKLKRRVYFCKVCMHAVAAVKLNKWYTDI